MSQLITQTTSGTYGAISTTSDEVAIQATTNEYTTLIRLADKAYYNQKEIATVDQLENVSSFIIRRWTE